jgi:hypothetical protein
MLFGPGLYSLTVLLCVPGPNILIVRLFFVVCCAVQVMLMTSTLLSWRAQGVVRHAHAQGARHLWWQLHAELAAVTSPAR